MKNQPATAKPEFHPIRSTRRRDSDAEPVADAEREPVAASTAAAAEPVAAKVETVEAEAAPAEPVPEQAAGPVQAESATAKVDRLKREIGACETVQAEVVAQLADLALGCERGDVESLATRRKLRLARESLAERLGDKQAALAVVRPLAEAERAQRSTAQRDGAFADCETLLGYAEGWAAEADRAIHALARALDGHRRAQEAWIAISQRHVPAASHWLMEQDAGTLESVLLARMVRLGMLDPRHAPGVMLSGRNGLADAVREHTASVRARLASLAHDADRPAREPAAEWIAGTGAVPWALTRDQMDRNAAVHAAERVNPLADALARA
ncbi:MAG: hypothetical protein HIU82_13920 [Proteobacteria bacterium]|nr:hypothetical protein [Pseudomonadota bacterium]